MLMQFLRLVVPGWHRSSSSTCSMFWHPAWQTYKALVYIQVWSSNQAASVAEIDIKANVCCAKYNPESMYKVAVGAADHTVHTYDLRKADKAVHVFRGMPLACFVPASSYMQTDFASHKCVLDLHCSSCHRMIEHRQLKAAQLVTCFAQH